MLAIKLKMVGRRNQRSFRVIVQEARTKVRGNFVEDLGWYNPHTNEFKIDSERVSYWMKNGAQPTETVRSLIRKSKSGSEVETYIGTPKVRKSKKAPKEEPQTVEESTEEVKTEEVSGDNSKEEQPIDVPSEETEKEEENKLENIEEPKEEEPKKELKEEVEAQEEKPIEEDGEVK